LPDLWNEGLEARGLSDQVSVLAPRCDSHVVAFGRRNHVVDALISQNL